MVVAIDKAIGPFNIADGAIVILDVTGKFAPEDCCRTGETAISDVIVKLADPFAITEGLTTNDVLITNDADVANLPFPLNDDPVTSNKIAPLSLTIGSL